MAALAGCHDAPSCADAVHAAHVSSDPADVAAIVDICQQKGWSGDVRTCLAKGGSRAVVLPCLDPVIGDLQALFTQDAAKAEVAATRAEAAAEQAASDATDAAAKLAAAIKDLGEINDRVAKATVDVTAATDDASRAAAKAALDQLRTDAKAVRARVAAANAAASQAERAKAQSLAPGRVAGGSD